MRLSEIPHEELGREVLTSGLFRRDQVMDAVTIQAEADRDSIAPRGKRGENLFTYRQWHEAPDVYQLPHRLPPEKGSQWSCMSNFLFWLAGSAREDPAYVTVQFDDLYLINHIVFEGYYDTGDVHFTG